MLLQTLLLQAAEAVVKLGPVGAGIGAGLVALGVGFGIGKIGAGAVERRDDMNAAADDRSPGGNDAHVDGVGVQRPAGRTTHRRARRRRHASGPRSR